MVNKVLNVSAAVEEAQSLPYSMICSLSGVYLGALKIPDSLDEVTWARFFGEDCEIRLFRDGDELKAAEISEDGDDFYDRYYKSENTRLFGKGIRVRHIIGYDEDGQAYIATSRLCGTEEM